jgi:carboxylesterase type B
VSAIDTSSIPIPKNLSVMLLQSLLLLSAYATSAVASCDGANDTLVKTSLFTVQGVIGDTPNVRVFRGIPYAEPPIGPRRFRPPFSKKPEASVINATYFGDSCIQLDTGAATAYTQYLNGFLLTPGQQQSENCLTLNIWAPRAQPNQSLPVMIYLPGGAFTSGGSASPYKYGENIVRDHQDVIVVSIK